MATTNATVMSVDNPSSPGSVASPSVKTVVLNDAATANGVKPGAQMKPGLKGKNEPQASTNLEAEAAAAVCAQPTKTPVSVLQELCVKRQITPKYDLIQIEGSVHEPTFKYRVTVGEYIEHGTGQSKKKAKHAAAKAVLDKLVGNAGVLRNGAPTPVVEAKSEVQSPYEDGIPGNPVGNLQEFCMSRRLPPPVYELSAEDGLPHERLFTIDCIIGSHRASGSGKSKKLAKRQAAYKLLQALRDVQPEDSHGGNLEEEDDEGGLGRLPGLKDAKISVMNPAHSAKLLQFHKSLMVAKGEKITALKTMSLAKEGFNYAQFLQELAREQNFEVTFVDIEEMSKSGKYQCLVQLSTLPVAVCYGSGTDQKLAQEAAAHNALEYLKVMAK